MNKGKASPVLVLLLLLAMIYILNPVRLIPAVIKLRFKGAVLVLIGIALLVILVMYYAFRQNSKQGKPEEQQMTDAINAKARQRIVQLRSMGMNIKNQNISSRTEEICQAVEKMMSVSENDTDKTVQADRFIVNSLITLGSVLTKFARLETNNSLTDDVAANAIDCLEKIKTAAENHTQNILKNDIMDIAVEMETLLAMAKRDGLLAEEGFSFGDEQQQITLVL
ncbi:MAG: 5-bromo-4-chloroindolyl phosphate hydrolysis family protein [Oscillospiraceae bacterium]|nr:5-bromo-4-chloroindolyl phosphate hydrolysis family protein [Oscillospiraceae bacterium]